ncbi:hypothetical protein KO561_06745 [Radiobacillus kanasensis]|uniref:hypothetical protein n=1 Tax=Radiobacillus kanasensis TaxID=2844358 RepID=UPI001E2DB530|nr:hypothetical protein [Radiobacillus kanasensis]UFU00627.1 hypothetical protein KO561_06745 [Radiobacillus kanasensis]
MNMKKKAVFFLLMLIIVFGVIPFSISLAYGNIPLFDNNDLESYDVLVTNDEVKNDTEISFLSDSTYTWGEIKKYVIRNEMSYLNVLRIVAVIVGISFLAVVADRLLFRNSRGSFKR